MERTESDQHEQSDPFREDAPAIKSAPVRGEVTDETGRLDDPGGRDQDDGEKRSRGNGPNQSAKVPGA